MPITPPVILSVREISFAYGKSVILEHVSFDLHKGDYVGIIGPNGGGKTTLLKIILGLLRPTHGTVHLLAQPIAKSLARGRVGYVPQYLANDIRALPATVAEVVASGSSLRGASSKAAVKKALKAAGVAGLSSRRIGELSGGERQRVLIARALAGDPLLLILDEPTSAIDASGQEEFYAFLRKLHKQGITIIMVSHDVDIVAHEVDTVICLNKHLVCHGPTEHVMNSKTLTRAYGKPANVLHQH